EERELLGLLLDSIESLPAAGHELLVATATYEPIDLSVSHLATKLIDLTDAKALAVLVEMAPRVFCVVRSRIPELDAAALAGALDSAVREPPRAADVMSTPPRSVSPDETVAHAMVSCQRHAQSGILVTEGSRLIGAVAREDLDKAIGHGLSHAPVKGIMSARV